VPVAILGSATFDVTTVDVSSVGFGPAGANPVRTGSLEDVNGDGFLDLVLHFRQQDTGLAPGNTQACLTATLIGDGNIMGCDSVNIVH